ncbi:MAG: chromosomal replication initiator protein DnaA [Clostridia bacterium]|nr:chromosomal replication initiator protein DnaA [Clostridia bacterium]
MPINDDLSALWDTVKDAMLDKFPRTSVDLWFGSFTLTDFDGSSATLVTDSDFKYRIVRERYIDDIRRYFELVGGYPVDVTLLCSVPGAAEPAAQPPVQAAAPSPAQAEPEPEPQKPTETIIGGTIPPFNFSYTFDNFVVGNSNKFAFAAASAVANNPAYRYNPLFIHGPSGLGKTHLMYAITNAYKQKNPRANIIYIKSEDFTNQLIESISRGAVSNFRNKYRFCDMLLIDDIQFIAGKESTQEEFFHTFNTLVESNRQVILASDRPPSEIKRLEERLKSRFEQGLLADIQPPDLELRTAIVKNKAESVNLDLPDDVVNFLAENLRSNIRQIEGAIKKLGAMSFVSGKPITMELARTSINDLLGGAEPVSVTVDKIFTSVCRKYGVTRSDLESTSRKKELAQPRHLCIYLIREVTGMSLPQIGKIFNRDHSTVINSVNAIEKKFRESHAFEVEVKEMIKEFRG